MKILLLLIVVSLLCQSQSQSCNTCSDHCSSSSSTSTWCRCDSHCHFFQDCCPLDSKATLIPTKMGTAACLPSHLTPLTPGAELQCTSAAYTYHTEVLFREVCKFFMVSSCPDSWVDPGGMKVRGECSNSSSPQPLPPVTDSETGLVYRNEFCAQCNGATRITAWEVSLTCDLSLYSYSSLENLLQANPDILTQQCWPCRFNPPQTNMSQEMLAPRPCRHTVRTCPPHSPQLRLSEEDYNQAKLACKNGSLDPVQGKTEVYHNIACGVCNGEKSTCLTGSMCKCQKHQLQTNSLSPTLSVSLILKGLGGGSLSVSSEHGDTATISVICPEGEVPVGLECRPTQCPEAYTLTGGRCSLDIASPDANGSLINCSSQTVALGNSSYTRSGNDIILLKWNNSTVNVLEYDSSGRPLICARNLSLPSQILNCSTALIALNHTEYMQLSNGSILFQETVLEVWYYDDSSNPLVCPDHLPLSKPEATSQDSNLPGISYLNYMGSFLSAVGTFLLLVTYCLFKELRTFPGLILMNLCAAILFNCLIYTIGSPLIEYFPFDQLCTTLAVLLHYSYLVQFAWLSIFSCEITRSFYLARKLSKESANTKQRLFFTSVVIAWVVPLAVIVILVILDFTTSNLVQYGSSDGMVMIGCWINHYQSFLVTFLVPLSLSLALNIVLFSITSALIFLAYKDQTKLGKIRSNNTTALIRIWLAAFILTGLSWILGFLAHLTTSWVWYLFTIFNTTQGFALSLSFVLTRKVVWSYLELLGLKKAQGLRNTSTTALSSSKIRRAKTTSFNSFTTSSNKPQ